MLKRFLQKQVMKLSPDKVDVIRSIYRDYKLLIESITSRKKILKSKRIGFLSLETAWLDDYKYLSPGDKDVEVSLIYSAISTGTETSVVTGLMPKSFPSYPGYSGVGVITKVGKNVSEFKVGDVVAGRIKHAKKSVVPVKFLFHVSQECSIKGAAFIEIAIIALQGVRKANITPGTSVLVVGLGVIGQMAIRLARCAGAAPICCTARSELREKQAVGPLGADKFYMSKDLNVQEYDVVLEVTGNSSALNLAIDRVAKGGKIILLGSNRTISKNLNLKKLASKNAKIIGAHITSLAQVYSHDMRWTYRDEGMLYMRLLKEKKIDFENVITHVELPTNCNKVYELLGDGVFKGTGILFNWKDV